MTYISILVAAIASFAFGWLWYGPLFGKSWMKLVGLTMKDAKKADMRTNMIVGFVSAIVMATVLSRFIGSDVLGAIQTVALIWLGFLATTGLGATLWEQKPMKLYWINSIHYLGVFVIQATVLALF